MSVSRLVALALCAAALAGCASYGPYGVTYYGPYGYTPQGPITYHNMPMWARYQAIQSWQRTNWSWEPLYAGPGPGVVIDEEKPKRKVRAAARKPAPQASEPAPETAIAAPHSEPDKPAPDLTTTGSTPSGRRVTPIRSAEDERRDLELARKMNICRGC